MNASWPLVPLGALLHRSTRMIDVHPDAMYQEIKVRIRGKGVVERRLVKGVEIAADRRFVAQAGQFIISRIDARNGASGIVPPELNGAVVTNDFPLFDVVFSRLDPSFLDWMSKTASFVDLCKRASEGTTNRVRLSEANFTALEVFLPPLDEQRRIVARIEELTAKVAEANGLRSQTSKKQEALWPSLLNLAFRGQIGTNSRTDEPASSLLQHNACRHSAFRETKANNAHPHKPHCSSKGPFSLPLGWSWTTLGSVVTHLIDCVNDTPNFADHDTGFLGLKSTNIRPYFLDLRQRWFVSTEDFSVWNRRESPVPGDIVLTREAPVGYACRLPDGITSCLTQRLMLVRADPHVIMPELLLHYLNSPVFFDQVMTHSRGLTTPHIRVQDAPNFLLPLPPMPSQRRIVIKLNTLHTKVDTVKILQDETAAELDAMLPAILDKAFKGGL
ncbi:restriction endonuclease subunit S [Rhodomicrobium vannielii ATCC 17100]|uniref:restriction endonuclease subunit S n=1 Tax=Rhodomicrobium vannielii TaxID=1069 RepID=UPI00191B0369|nr:restriction endonuclease subunit S [Rhodomicrobium vannielii]MBJ7532669.1 restriction endonuclease subunit S [Rhodomicrobium vannielii ATCC 17100]